MESHNANFLPCSKLSAMCLMRKNVMGAFEMVFSRSADHIGHSLVDCHEFAKAHLPGGLADSTITSPFLYLNATRFANGREPKSLGIKLKVQKLILTGQFAGSAG